MPVSDSTGSAICGSIGEDIMQGRVALLMLATFVAGTGCARQELRPHTRSILVESPSDLPAMRIAGGADIFLHDTNGGRTYLYIESADGQKLSILDVTDPAAIRRAGDVTISALAPFDYIQDVNQLGALVRYRDNHGYAVLDLSRYNHPLLTQTPQLAGASTAENIGNFGLLLTSTRASSASGGSGPALPAASDRTYDIMDTSHGGTPRLVTSVPGVKRRLTKLDTGTLFLLADNGVTVVRNLRTEEEHATQMAAERQ
jgi:hypothetical protein